VELNLAGRWRNLRSDSFPGTGHDRGTLQAVGEIGNAFEIDEVAASAVRRQGESRSRTKAGEDVGCAGVRGGSVGLIAIDSDTVAVFKIVARAGDNVRAAKASAANFVK